MTFQKGASQPEKRVKLREVLEDLEFEQGYPHTVGYFRASACDHLGVKPEYLELRRIDCVEELWLFLNALNL